MKKLTTIVEVLEARIAPATLLVQPLGYDVYKDGGVLAGQSANELAAKNFTGAESAVFLATGDRLVFDANGNKKADAGEAVAVQVSGGQAMVILSDFDGDHVFDRNDIGALFTGGTFGGIINGDIGGMAGVGSGSIVTALNVNGALVTNGALLVVQDSAIDGLTVNGVLGGNIIAGDFIAHVKTGKPTLFTADRPGAQYILAGSADFAPALQFAGGFGVDLDFTQITGAGPSVTDLNLATGALLIGSGKGVSAGAAGGNIERVTILNQTHELRLQAGRGADGPSGGNGGSLLDIKAASIAAHGAFVFTGGAGGAGSTGSGGDGGGVKNATLSGKMMASDIYFLGGFGGGGTTGTGGDGGSLENISATFAVVSGDVSLNAGQGGGTATGPAGGNGGSITKSRVSVATMSYGNIRIAAGRALGDNAGAGNATGGAVTDFQITSTDLIAGDVSVLGGSGAGSGAGGTVTKGKIALSQVTGPVSVNGGNGGTGNGSNGTVGGAGGAVSEISLTSKSLFSTDYTIRGGLGGRGANGDGGDGGKVSKIKATLAVAETVEFTAGSGGDATMTGGTGTSGDGGAVEDVTVAAQRITDSVLILGGLSDSRAANGNATAGKGGDVTRVKLAAAFAENVNVSAGTTLFDSNLIAGGIGGSVVDVSISGAKFGDVFVESGDGAGGGNSHGGDIARLKIAAGIVTVGVSIYTGNGGESNVAALAGGNGGRFIGASTVTLAAASRNLDVHGGFGGDGLGAAGGAGGGIGGTLGSLTITTNAMNNVDITGGDGGEGDGVGAGGAGGSLSFKYTAKGVVNNFTVESGTGGDAAGAAAGAAGAVEKSAFTIPALTGAFTITGGRGGDVGAGGGNGGAGGKLSLLTLSVPGAVMGNFTLTSGRGGSVNAGTGTGGGGGDIGDVKIAAGSVFGAGVLVTSGNGSAGNSGGGGGVGGDIERLSVALKSISFGVSLTSGDGGITSAGAAANGGNGGNIAGVTVSVAHITDELIVTTGDGRAGIGIGGNGGDGGDITGFILKGSQLINNGVDFQTGVGGRASNNAAHTGNGGNGGDVSNSVIAVKATTNLEVDAGDGGDSGAGGGNSGNGGGISGSSFKFGAIADGGAFLTTGDGGTQRGATGFVAGHGGGITGTLLDVLAGTMDKVEVRGGGGGSAFGPTGDGGNLSKITVNLGKETIVTDHIQFIGGDSAQNERAAGGAGGDVSEIVVNARGTFASLTILGGDGGTFDDDGHGVPPADGGDAGAVSRITLNLSGGGSSVIGSEVLIQGGLGGGSDLAASGGGGGVSDVVIAQTGRVDRVIEILGGEAQNAGTTSGNGGGIERVKITDPLSASSYFLAAGRSIFAATQGGDGGSVSGVSIAAPKATFDIRGGAGGGSGDGAGLTAGDGGKVEKITGTGGTISLYGGEGGEVGESAGGTGGTGGSILDITLTATRLVNTIAAGQGGDARIGFSDGGTGGGIARVKITGDIGNFGIPLNTGTLHEAGGLFAGAGGGGDADGIAGSIDTVSARRISAIMAIRSSITTADALTNVNAVTAIANVIATQIGTDLDGDGAFDFTDAGTAGFSLGAGDTALDGLVIVKAAGFTATSLSVTPLKALGVL